LNVPAMVSGTFTPTLQSVIRDRMNLHGTVEKPRGKIMIGALVREINGTGIMKIVTGYQCNSRDEMIQFGGDHKAWWNLTNFEILSTDE